MFVVNLFGVPSAGKSTCASYIFYKLKTMGLNVELVTEFAKDKVYENNKKVFENQAYIFGKQYFRISRLNNEVDIVITDSPLLLSAFYNKSKVLGDDFNKVVLNVFKSYKNLNYMILRCNEYKKEGRIHTEEESDSMLVPMVNMLDNHNIDYISVKGSLEGYNIILKDIMNKINK